MDGAEICPSNEVAVGCAGSVCHPWSSGRWRASVRRALAGVGERDPERRVDLRAADLVGGGELVPVDDHAGGVGAADLVGGGELVPVDDHAGGVGVPDYVDGADADRRCRPTGPSRCPSSITHQRPR
ncbi:hypothetical protein [Halovivax sp.]|uniref:hypothetical protein n=1 Tax=Halovivax sp. TaxID=1935978 RepID=UPI0025B96914|nr:hypothetical protein [Halovivax sp.]